MKGLLLLIGESFREGLQFERKRDTKKSFYTQKMASESHIDFCNYVKEKHNVSMDIFINTYDTKYEKELKSWYPNCKYKSNKELIGQKLAQDAINEIDKEYDFIFLTRMDIFIKPYFYSVFNPKWKTIHFLCQGFSKHVCEGFIDNSPMVNEIFQYFPKKYYYVLNEYNAYGESWRDYHKKFHIPHSKMDFMVDTRHDSDSYKDYNPYYRFVGRPECTIWHDRGKKINRKLFGKKRTCKKIKGFEWKTKSFKQYHLP
jgi:hypothetical protein